MIQISNIVLILWPHISLSVDIRLRKWWGWTLMRYWYKSKYYYKLSSFSVASQREAKPGSGDPAAQPEAAGLPQQGGAPQAAALHGHRGPAAGGQAEQRGGRTRFVFSAVVTRFHWPPLPLTAVGFSSRRRTGWRWRGLSPAPSSTAGDSPRGRWTWWFCSWWTTTVTCLKWVGPTCSPLKRVALFVLFWFFFLKRAT